MTQITAKNVTLGDSAVDGLLGGIAAGIVMAIFLIVANLFGGDGFAVLTRFDPNRASPLVGTLMHLAVSGVYGAAFGIGAKWVSPFNVPMWLVGILFGVALFALAELVLIPTSHSALAGISFVHFGIAHLIYGLVIGWIISRNSKS